LVLSPHKLRHSYYQKRIADLLRAHLERYAAAGNGEWMMAFAVETAGGVKVPDVVWISEERWTTIPEDAEASAVCPELVVEVLSRSNTTAEMDDKRRLYFEAGAHEFWTCDINGRMRFFGPAGEPAPSEMVPAFPASIA
jgi:Uma2 family endonuclease